MNRGYKSAVVELSDLKALVQEIRALRDLRGEMLAKIRSIPPRQVTATEVKRDIGFSQSSVRLLERSGWLPTRQISGHRRTYDLPSVLRLAVDLPGMTSISRVRMRR